MGNLQQCWEGQGHTVKPESPPPPFFFAVLCFDRSWSSLLCLLMSTVEPTAEGTPQPKRNKETARGTTDCLQRAMGEGIGTTHELILLCPSSRGVRRCTPLCLVLGFATLVAFGKFGDPPTCGLKHPAACRSAANFSWGPLVLGDDELSDSGVQCRQRGVVQHRHQ